MQITEHLRKIQDENKSGINKVQIVDSTGVNLNTTSIRSVEVTRLANTTQYSTGGKITIELTIE